MFPDHERFRFHFGPYEQPVYAFGDIVECAARGEVTIIRQSDGRIPWPVGFPTGTGNRGRGTLILFDGLKLAGLQFFDFQIEYPPRWYLQ